MSCTYGGRRQGYLPHAEKYVMIQGELGEEREETCVAAGNPCRGPPGGHPKCPGTDRGRGTRRGLTTGAVHPPNVIPDDEPGTNMCATETCTRHHPARAIAGQGTRRSATDSVTVVGLHAEGCCATPRGLPALTRPRRLTHRFRAPSGKVFRNKQQQQRKKHAYKRVFRIRHASETRKRHRSGNTAGEQFSGRCAQRRRAFLPSGEITTTPWCTYQGGCLHRIRTALCPEGGGVVRAASKGTRIATTSI